MNTLPPPLSAAVHAGPPRRALALLAAAVLIAHTLVLTSVPARFGAERPSSPKATLAFVTRSVPLPKPAEPPPAALPEAAAAAKPKPKPVRKQASEDVSAAEPIGVPEPRPADYTPDAPRPADLPAEAASPGEAPTASASEGAQSGPAEAPVPAVALPGNVVLEYKMTGVAKGLNYYASAELRWENAGDAYETSLRVSALFIGSRSMASIGKLGPGGLEPRRFSDKSRTEVAAHFLPEKKQITFSANTPSLPWVDGAQDRLSVFMQLGGMLAGNRAGFPTGSTISLYTVGPRDADTWTFLVEAEENLTLPCGEVAAIKLTRQPRREFDQKVEIWYAPSLSYLPVRNKITQSNGDFIDQQLNTINTINTINKD